MPAGRVRIGLAAGEPLLARDLLPLGVAAVGRTFAIPIETTVIDGLGLQAGDRVDVIGADGDGAMHYVVADAEVVRLPATAGSTAFAAASSRSAWVTVAVDDREALLLSQALGQGSVELVRSTGSAAIEITEAALPSDARPNDGMPTDAGPTDDEAGATGDGGDQP